MRGRNTLFTPVYGVFLEKSGVPEHARDRLLRCRSCPEVRFAGSDAAKKSIFVLCIWFCYKKDKRLIFATLLLRLESIQ